MTWDLITQNRVTGHSSLYSISNRLMLNSLAPRRFQFNFRLVIFKLTLVNGGWGISYEIALRWTPLDLTDDKSTLVQVMAWCRQAPSHYLSQCWLRSLSPYGVTRPQWVNLHNCHQLIGHVALAVITVSAPSTALCSSQINATHLSNRCLYISSMDAPS